MTKIGPIFESQKIGNCSFFKPALPINNQKDADMTGILGKWQSISEKNRIRIRAQLDASGQTLTGTMNNMVDELENHRLKLKEKLSDQYSELVRILGKMKMTKNYPSWQEIESGLNPIAMEKASYFDSPTLLLIPPQDLTTIKRLGDQRICLVNMRNIKNSVDWGVVIIDNSLFNVKQNNFMSDRERTNYQALKESVDMITKMGYSILSDEQTYITYLMVNILKFNKLPETTIITDQDLHPFRIIKTIGMNHWREIAHGGVSPALTKDELFICPMVRICLHPTSDNVETKQNLNKKTISVEERFRRIPFEVDQPARTKDLLQNTELTPTEKIIVGEYNFYFGKIYLGKSNAITVGFVKIGKQYHARLFYKSRSSGTWRSCPCVTNKEQKGIHMEKGEHYTQSTLVDPKLATKLDQILLNDDTKYEPDDKIIRQYFSDEDSALKGDFLKETMMYTLDHLYCQFKCGYFGTGKTGMYEITKETIKNFVTFCENLPENFIPDFSKEPMKRRIEYNGFVGNVTIESYRVDYNGTPLIWEMAQDSNGRAWIYAIYGQDTKINSYGVREFTIDSGALTSKPFEYSAQCNLLDPKLIRPCEKDEKYTDITPFLATLKPIRKYLESKNLKIK